MRSEFDKIGEVQLPDDALYGVQTARARDNFAIGGRGVSLKLVYAIVTIKKAAALTYRDLGLMDPAKAEAIVSACENAMTGVADEAFFTNALQGGAGTSTNMNVNEVIANLALRNLGRPYGDYAAVHPLDRKSVV